MKKFHASLELGQHGPKGLTGCLYFAGQAGCDGAQPSNYLLEDGGGGFLSPSEIQEVFEEAGLSLDGISAHCVFWVHGTAHTGTKTVRPFIPAELHSESPERIEAWAEDYILRLMDLSAELKRFVIPMFWGLYQGYELATGYPWGFAKGPGYDLHQEGEERFVTKTQKIRDYANSLGIKLAHEIHANSGAICADDFLRLVEITDQDPCLGVFADPSHCWEGETVEDRFTKVGPYIYGAHAKDFVVVPGRNLRSSTANWRKRAMHFTRLGKGQVDLHRYVEILLDSGLPERWNRVQKTQNATVPLCAEAESAHVALDLAAEEGVDYVSDELCWDVAEGSFEDGMGTGD